MPDPKATTESRTAPPWQPVWTGDSGARAPDAPDAPAAIAAIGEIAAQLDRDYRSWALSSRPDPFGLRAVSLASGPTGPALFFGYLAKAELYDNADEIALRFLNQAIELMPDTQLSASLFCGFAGVAWVADHLPRLWGQTPDPDLTAQVDEILVEMLQDEGGVAPYDLIDGLVGIGVYALHRLPEGNPQRCIDLILDHLEQRAVAREVGRSWPTGLAPLPEDGPGQGPDERAYNLGLSHGVPGVIAFLALLCQIDYALDRVLPLLGDAVDWLLAQRMTDQERSIFPISVSPTFQPRPARTAWCYGDPGVACALLYAARGARRPDWEAIALDIAHCAARRSFDQTEIVDVGLCHGTSGVAMIFQQIARATGDPVCLQTARAYYERCFAMRKGGSQAPAGPTRPARNDDEASQSDIAGFATFSFERVHEGEYIADPSWLTGAAGLGLALLAAATDIEPLWHRLLLIDIPAP